jgi:hypothetical protein
MKAIWEADLPPHVARSVAERLQPARALAFAPVGADAYLIGPEAAPVLFRFRSAMTLRSVYEAVRSPARWLEGSHLHSHTAAPLRACTRVRARFLNCLGAMERDAPELATALRRGLRVTLADGRVVFGYFPPAGSPNVRT